MSMPLLFSGVVVIGRHAVSWSEEKKTRALEMKSNVKKSVRTRSCGASHLGKHRAASKPIFIDVSPLSSRGESTGVPSSVSMRWDNHFCEDSEANLQLLFVWRSKSSVSAIRSMT
jgi:hypothetical protein